MTVTTPNGSDSSTRWDGKPPSTGALHIWFMNRLPFLLPEKHSSLFRTNWPTQFFSRVFHCQLQIRCLELRRRAVLLTVYLQKRVCAIRWVDCLLGQRRLWNDTLNTYVTITAAMTSANWSHQTFAFGIEWDWRFEWYVVYVCVVLP